jgi:hypothetical protein
VPLLWLLHRRSTRCHPLSSLHTRLRLLLHDARGLRSPRLTTAHLQPLSISALPPADTPTTAPSLTASSATCPCALPYYPNAVRCSGCDPSRAAAPSATPLSSCSSVVSAHGKPLQHQMMSEFRFAWCQPSLFRPAKRQFSLFNFCQAANNSKKCLCPRSTTPPRRKG